MIWGGAGVREQLHPLCQKECTEYWVPGAWPAGQSLTLAELVLFHPLLQDTVPFQGS